MAGELLPSNQARFFECSWVGQFRAVDQEKARLLAQAVANEMASMGVHDVGYDVRIMPREALEDPQSTRLIDEVNRASQPAGVPHPWSEGLSIFPEGHPYRQVEDAVKRGARSADEHKVLAVKLLELTQGESDGEDDSGSSAGGH